MSGGDVQLFVAERRNGTRLAVVWRASPDRHYIEIRIEARTKEGWKPTARSVSVGLSEIFNLGDAVEKACKLAGTVRR